MGWQVLMLLAFLSSDNDEKRGEVGLSPMQMIPIQVSQARRHVPAFDANAKASNSQGEIQL
jgi:hypothetical protein